MIDVDNREKIELSEDEAQLLYDKYACWCEHLAEYFGENGTPLPNNISSQYDIVSEEQDELDLEHSYRTLKVVVKRKSDGKFFRGGWTESPWGNDYDELELEEVFPFQTTITLYS